MSTIRWPFLGAIFLILLALATAAGCAPVAVEPAAVSPAAVSPAAVSPAAVSPEALAAAPGAPTATPPPYPWPTPPPDPTGAPEPTEAPTATLALDPTTPPTPVVTPIPTAAPPLLPFPEGTTPQPFSLYWREGDVIRTMRSDAKAPEIFFDPGMAGLHLTPTEAGFFSWGAVSPDGQTLAVVLTKETEATWKPGTFLPVDIYLVDRGNGKSRLLVNSGAGPVWSLDGKRLAYRSVETGGLWVAEVATGTAKEVYAADPDVSRYPTEYDWAPDNLRLVVQDEIFFEPPDLVIVNTETKQVWRVIEGGSKSWPLHPRWSPADDQIAVMWSNLGLQLRIVALDGSMVEASNILIGGGIQSWSPDGRWLAFSGSIRYESELFQSDLWLMDAMSLDTSRLTYNVINSPEDTIANELAPVWSPDGRQLAYCRGGDEVWVLSLTDGTGRLLFTSSHIFGTGGLVVGR